MHTRAIAEGAVAAAIIVLFSILNLVFGVFTFFIPLPLAIIVYRHNLKSGIVVSLAAAAVIGIVSASPILGLEQIIVGILGITIGLALKENFSFGTVFCIAVGAAIIATIMRLTTLAVVMDYSLTDYFNEIWNNLSQQLIALEESADLSEDFFATQMELLSVFPNLLQMLIPIWILSISVFDTGITLFLLRIVGKPLGIKLPEIKPFIEWKLPWYFVWGFIFSKALALILTRFPHYYIQVVALNLDIFFSFLFFVQGIAIMWFYLTRAGIKKFFRVVLTILLVLTGNNITVYIFTMLGVLDTWFDIRKLSKVDKEEK